MNATLLIWLTIIGAGLVTYAIRLSFIVLLGSRAVPDSVRRALRLRSHPRPARAIVRPREPRLHHPSRVPAA